MKKNDRYLNCLKFSSQDEVFVLDVMTVTLARESHSGSDNSWKIKIYDENDRPLCQTSWLDRSAN